MVLFASLWKAKHTRCQKKMLPCLLEKLQLDSITDSYCTWWLTASCSFWQHFFLAHNSPESFLFYSRHSVQHTSLHPTKHSLFVSTIDTEQLVLYNYCQAHLIFNSTWILLLAVFKGKNRQQICWQAFYRKMTDNVNVMMADNPRVKLNLQTWKQNVNSSIYHKTKQNYM